MDAILQIIQTVGFPIAVAVACAWFIYTTDKRSKDEAKAREEKQAENIAKLAEALNGATKAINEGTEINKELSETNKMLVNEMKAELQTVGKNVDKILDKVSK